MVMNMCEHLPLVENIIFPLFFAALFILIFNQEKEYKGSFIGEITGPLAPVFDKHYVKEKVRWVRPILGVSFLTIIGIYIAKVNTLC